MKPPSTVEARVAEELRNWLSSELEQLDAPNTNQFAHHVVTILLHEDLDIEDEPLTTGDDFLHDIYSIRKGKTRDKQKKAAVQFLRSAVCCNDPVEADIQIVVDELMVRIEETKNKMNSKLSPKRASVNSFNKSTVKSDSNERDRLRLYNEAFPSLHSNSDSSHGLELRGAENSVNVAGSRQQVDSLHLDHTFNSQEEAYACHTARRVFLAAFPDDVFPSFEATEILSLEQMGSSFSDFFTEAYSCWSFQSAFQACTLLKKFVPTLSPLKPLSQSDLRNRSLRQFSPTVIPVIKQSDLRTVHLDPSYERTLTEHPQLFRPIKARRDFDTSPRSDNDMEVDSILSSKQHRERHIETVVDKNHSSVRVSLYDGASRNSDPYTVSVGNIHSKGGYLEGANASFGSVLGFLEDTDENHDKNVGTADVDPDESVGTVNVDPDESVGTVNVDPDESVGTVNVDPDESVGTVNVDPDESVGTVNVDPDESVGTFNVDPDESVGTVNVDPDESVGTADVDLKEKVVIVKDMYLDINVNTVRDVDTDTKIGTVRNLDLNKKVGTVRDVNSDTKVGIVRDVDSDMKVDIVRDVESDMKVGIVRYVDSDTKVGTVRDVDSDKKVGTVRDVDPDKKVGTVRDVDPDKKVGTVRDVDPDKKVGTVRDVDPDKKVGTVRDVDPDKKVGTVRDVGTNTKLYIAGDESMCLELTMPVEKNCFRICSLENGRNVKGPLKQIRNITDDLCDTCSSEIDEISSFPQHHGGFWQHLADAGTMTLYPVVSSQRIYELEDKYHPAAVSVSPCREHHTSPASGVPLVTGSTDDSKTSVHHCFYHSLPVVNCGQWQLESARIQVQYYYAVRQVVNLQQKHNSCLRQTSVQNPFMPSLLSSCLSYEDSQFLQRAFVNSYFSDLLEGPAHSTQDRFSGIRCSDLEHCWLSAQRLKVGGLGHVEVVPGCTCSSWLENNCHLGDSCPFSHPSI